MSKGQDLWRKAKTIIPTGNQLISKRAELFLPGQWPAYYNKALGCSIWDLEGNHYYDFAQMGVGTCVLGYADPDVNKAVHSVVENGSMATLNAPEEVELAELLIDLHPWSDMVRFARTGGEACSIAIRIARAATGKSKVLFCGYHGWHDWYIASNLENAENLNEQLLPGLHPSGVPKELLGTAIPFFYNDLSSFEKGINENRDEIACIIMEPRRGSVPNKGFLEAIRKRSKEIGAVLIFDEITSGFRVNPGGIHLIYGVKPDMSIFGKGMGNGYPIAAVIGKRNIMVAAEGSFISSTCWTEKLGFAAALATIKKFVDKEVHIKLISYGESVNEIWRCAASENKIKISIDGIPPLTHINFNYEDNQVIQTLFTQEMLSLGFLQGAAVYTTFAYNKEVLNKYSLAVNKVFNSISGWMQAGRDVRKYLKGPIRTVGFSRLN